jgi:hypothetical protein
MPIPPPNQPGQHKSKVERVAIEPSYGRANITWSNPFFARQSDPENLVCLIRQQTANGDHDGRANISSLEPGCFVFPSRNGIALGFAEKVWAERSPWP